MNASDVLDESAIDPRLRAGIELLRNWGATDVSLRYSDDPSPVLWLAVAEFERDHPAGGPVPAVAAVGAPTPFGAVMRLCDQVIDGPLCPRCHRPTVFTELEVTASPPEGIEVCVLGWATTAERFERSCEMRP